MWSWKQLLARILAWLGLLSDSTDEPKVEYFSQALSIWTRWVEKVLPQPKEEDKDEMLEVTKILGLEPARLPFLTLLGLMNDFFEVKRQSLLRVQTLHLLLKVHTHLTESLDTLIPVYANLALQYLHLGYTGKAGTLFAQATQIMKDSSPSTSTQLTWHLNYAEYYATIGAVTKAKSHVSQAGQVFARNLVLSGKRIDAKERSERIWAVGRAGYVLSLISFEENELEKAIGYIDYGIRVLKTGISAVEKAQGSRSQDHDPFSSEARPFQEEGKGTKFGCRLWSFKTVLPHLLLGEELTENRHFWPH